MSWNKLKLIFSTYFVFRCFIVKWVKKEIWWKNCYLSFFSNMACECVIIQSDKGQGKITSKTIKLSIFKTPGKKPSSLVFQHSALALLDQLRIFLYTITIEKNKQTNNRNIILLKVHRCNGWFGGEIKCLHKKTTFIYLLRKYTVVRK